MTEVVHTSAKPAGKCSAVIVRSNAEWSSFQSYRENFGGRNIMWEIKCMKSYKTFTCEEYHLLRVIPFIRAHSCKRASRSSINFHVAMAPNDSDSSDESGSFTTTNVMLGYASKEATEDEFSQLGGYPVWLPGPQ